MTIIRMIINYFGEGCFRLQSGELSLLVNPQNNRLKADVILRTLALTEPESESDSEKGAQEIGFAGEYEAKGIEVRGFELEKESSAKVVKTIYEVFWEDLRFLFLGHLSDGLAPEILEEIGEPDLVFLPTGDDHFLSPEDAAKLMKRLEPKMIIPGYHKSPEPFLKAMGVAGEKMDKFVFRKKDLGEEQKARVIVLRADS